MSNRYVVTYAAAGYGDYGRYYTTIREGVCADTVKAQLIMEKRGEPMLFDWVEVDDIQPVEDALK